MSHLGRRAGSLLAVLVLYVSAVNSFAADDYQLGPDSMPQEGVPKGKVAKYTFDKSKVFPGTTRDYWIYVPAQYKSDGEPACVMIYQDGGSFINEKGAFRATTVMDNLIHKKEMPVTMGVFINPGTIPPPKDAKAHPRFNRSFEYDSTTDLYARFLTDEILPEVAKQYNISKEPAARGLCGSSSGGIAAFTAAWERPNQFTRVISFIGSFTNLRGGHNYPSLIRKTEPKPIRVFLQDGSNDLDIYSGSWWVGNQDVVAALKFAGYEHQWVPGDGGHNGKHGGAVLPDALRYVWKDYPKAPVAGTMSGVDKRNVMDILIPGEAWQIASEGHRFTEGPSAAEDGTIYFAADGNVMKLAMDGKVSVVAKDPGGADGMEMGPGGKIYAALNRKNQIAAIDPASGESKVVAEDIQPNDCVVTHKGHVYVTDHRNRQVWHVSPDGQKEVVDKNGLQFPNGITLTPDQTQLIVADMNGAGLYIFSIDPQSGKLSNRQLFCFCQIPPDKSTSGADGLAVDDQGRVYAATHMGIQVFDAYGRVNAIIPGPVPGRRPSNLVLGGPNLEYIYVTQGDKLWKRKTKAKGVLFFQDPILPPTPRG
jgi:sugar lactone lactonase YvrE/enterochelin esterase-like enzyme